MPLIEAVRADRPDELLRFLKRGMDPDERVRLNGSEPAIYSRGGPLHLCASTGKLDMARMLLERGADPNAEVYAAGSVLFRAYASTDAAMVQLIESYGGFLDAASAGFLRQTELARRMLADEDAGRLREGIVPAGAKLAETLLWSACGGGDSEIVRMALERVDWPREDHRWHWPLWQALTAERRGPEGGLACFRLLLERAGPNVSTFGRTILHDVVASGKHVSAEDRLPFAAMLLEGGARLDRRDDLLKSTPLGWACRWGHPAMAKLLLERGADPVEADAEPWANPRAWAGKMGHGDVLALLRNTFRREA
jgi:ankyrin repeat protein